MAELSAQDFSTFFEELWGYQPYRWQWELAAWIDRHRRFPSLVPVATGGGKTSLLDIGLFVLAIDAQRAIAERWAPRRIALVVDRRVVVDQNGFRGQQIADKIQHASAGSVLGRVSDLLASLSGNGAFPPLAGPVNAAVLRGGIARDETWAQRPDTPAVIASTVDQVGSRLLFRGYGMSRGARPIHAGLLGADTVVLLDEVHLAVPFAETLSMITGLRRRSDTTSPAGDRFHVCELSATPRLSRPAGSSEEPPFVEWFEDPMYERRTSVSKPTRLAPVVATTPEAEAQQLAKAVAENVRSLLAEEQEMGSRVMAVLMNQVDRAAAVAQHLESSSDVDVKLITGRMRALDRDHLLSQPMAVVPVDVPAPTADPDQPTRIVSLDEILRERAHRSALSRHVVVVATQCLEAGADYDFDALVTECASIDALVQRFGRLDRRGILPTGERPRAVIVAGSSDIAGTSRLYGPALMNTWARLVELSGVDGIVDMGSNRALLELFAEDSDGGTAADRSEPKYRLRTSSAPVLLRPHLDLLSATNPEPAISPDPALWLHGLDPSVPEISVIWREELSAEVDAQIQTADEKGRSTLAQQLTGLLQVTRPSAGEMVTIPSYALSALFNTQGPAPGTFDVEAVPAAEDNSKPGPKSERLVVAWNGNEVDLVPVGQISPGVVVVLPPHLGGLKQGTWSTSSIEVVTDCAEEAVQNSPRIVKFVRLNSHGLAPPTIDDEQSKQLARLARRYGEVEEEDRSDWLGNWADQWIGTFTADEAAALKDGSLRHLSSGDVTLLELGLPGLPGTGALLVMTFRTSGDLDLDDGDEDTEDPSFIGRPASLRVHLRGVGDWAECFGRSLFAESDLVDDLRLAGQLHDLGKADPRFQLWLSDGVPSGGELLAKSGSRRRSRHERDASRRQAGYPRGMRHELLSVELMQRCETLLKHAHDRDLVLHLVASHHGYCRPQAGVVSDTRPVSVAVAAELAFDGSDGIALASSDHALARIDSGVIARFVRVRDRYGWYRMAWLEAILRLADHRQSEIDARGDTR
jgi:CRISPR-associated endonuclease/helicase Cas3